MADNTNSRSWKRRHNIMKRKSDIDTVMPEDVQVYLAARYQGGRETDSPTTDSGGREIPSRPSSGGEKLERGSGDGSSTSSVSPLSLSGGSKILHKRKSSEDMSKKRGKKSLSRETSREKPVLSANLSDYDIKREFINPLQSLQKTTSGKDLKRNTSKELAKESLLMKEAKAEKSGKKEKKEEKKKEKEQLKEEKEQQRKEKELQKKEKELQRKEKEKEKKDTDSDKGKARTKKLGDAKKKGVTRFFVNNRSTDGLQRNASMATVMNRDSPLNPSQSTNVRSSGGNVTGGGGDSSERGSGGQAGPIPLKRNLSMSKFDDSMTGLYIKDKGKSRLGRAYLRDKDRRASALPGLYQPVVLDEFGQPSSRPPPASSSAAAASGSTSKRSPPPLPPLPVNTLSLDDDDDSPAARPPPARRESCV